MTVINYYKAEVKYTGSFDDYNADQFKAMADAEVDRGLDAFDYSEAVSEERADRWDGRIWVENRFPCNKLALVHWCYKTTNDEEDI